MEESDLVVGARRAGLRISETDLLGFDTQPSENASLMAEVRGEWPGWFVLAEKLQ